jgi:hypothetical protein
MKLILSLWFLLSIAVSIAGQQAQDSKSLYKSYDVTPDSVFMMG